MAEWFCKRCQRWVGGIRCKQCHAVMDPGPLGYTNAEKRAIEAGDLDG